MYVLLSVFITTICH